ncbi:calcium/sodium antiporter [Cognatilysobacter bugurensis]|uniref:Sodium:calcium antiporter n=1 Tax=Cognatilysobacter bugurensis TaxID=543356 RepID=A0A918SZF3_9GAMM|nr:calcium/sodium antiporter [Lysobacter bugurensis]GHA80508.1 sodium:calcium antiporter [Lysobacter bugurensis]
MTWLILLLGLGALLVGAEALVRGASRLALATGLSPLVIGLTVVAFGTSAPELAVGIGSVRSGASDVALGNVVGSNITNVLLILGISGLIAPLVVQRQLVWLDVPVMIAASLVVFALALDGRISRPEGLLLVAGGIAYLITQVHLGRREGAAGSPATAAEADVPAPATRRPLLDIAFVLGGLALLVLGAHWLVDSAVKIAEAFGLSELVIGLTVVAVGTSMPEIATSIIATARGERDLAVGNVVGSNILNLLLILGITVLFAPDGLPVGPAALNFDLPVMTAVAVACLPIFFTGHCIQRWEAAVFLGYYVAYTAYLLLDAAGHDALPAYSRVMLYFVVPLTAVTLAVVVARALNERRHRRRS